MTTSCLRKKLKQVRIHKKLLYRRQGEVIFPCLSNKGGIMEQEIMQLITYGGDARTKALQAIRAARNSQFEEADSLMKECGEDIIVAHRVQTTMLQNEAGGVSMPVPLLMVHAQDHLMDAMVIKDLAADIIELYKKFSELTEKAYEDQGNG